MDVPQPRVQARLHVRREGASNHSPECFRGCAPHFTHELEKLHPDNSDSHREQAGMCAITP